MNLLYSFFTELFSVISFIVFLSGFSVVLFDVLSIVVFFTVLPVVFSVVVFPTVLSVMFPVVVFSTVLLVLSPVVFSIVFPGFDGFSIKLSFTFIEISFDNFSFSNSVLLSDAVIPSIVISVFPTLA